MSKPLTVETPQRIWSVNFNWYYSVKMFSDLRKVLNVSSKVFISIRFPSFFILKRLQAGTPCCFRYSVTRIFFSFVLELSVTVNAFARIEGFMFCDSDIYIKEFCNF